MPFAAWRHRDARDGFEVVFIDGRRFEGHSVAVEDGRPYAVRYRIELDERRRTRAAQVWSQEGNVTLEGDGEGRWRVDGAAAARLDGCLDVDLEAWSVAGLEFLEASIRVKPKDSDDAEEFAARAERKQRKLEDAIRERGVVLSEDPEPKTRRVLTALARAGES